MTLRREKGSELTIEEMDNNLEIAKSFMRSGSQVKEQWNTILIVPFTAEEVFNMYTVEQRDIVINMKITVRASSDIMKREETFVLETRLDGEGVRIFSPFVQFNRISDLIHFSRNTSPVKVWELSARGVYGGFMCEASWHTVAV